MRLIAKKVLSRSARSMISLLTTLTSRPVGRCARRDACVQVLRESQVNVTTVTISRASVHPLFAFAPTTTIYQFDSSYTLSKATDDGQTSTTFIAVNNPFDPANSAADQGPSNFDIRHKFSASVIWAPKFGKGGKVTRAVLNGFTFSQIWGVTSGAPYSASTSGNPAGGVSGNVNGAGGSINRVPLFSRNSFRQPKIVNVDVRATRRFSVTEKTRLALSVEGIQRFESHTGYRSEHEALYYRRHGDSQHADI